MKGDDYGDMLDKSISIVSRGIVRAFERALALVGAFTEEFSQVMGQFTNGMNDATMLFAATPKEKHYILHSRKARVRKKWKRRVLRRAARAKRSANDGR